MKGISAAKESQKPGYSLCYKLLSEAFSPEILANSRGQGMTSVKEGDLGPCLDKSLMIFLLWRLFYIDYVVVWCKKNGHPIPLEKSYARKQIKIALKKQKYY
ncbi:hypothetical protein ACJMK2_032120 [Sinanodonta woodiana]|uniref:Uncharacterized protein n=1 Tax=Sinanodonta woodiana TaxID=1069815 RepID=A0ABD3X2A0_SINWO